MSKGDHTPKNYIKKLRGTPSEKANTITVFIQIPHTYPNMTSNQIYTAFLRTHYLQELILKTKHQ
jgi:hypothetical protein